MVLCRIVLDLASDLCLTCTQRTVTFNSNDTSKSGLEICQYNHLQKLTDEQPRKFVALLGKNKTKTRKKIEYGFAKIRQILGNFHNDEAMDLRCRCPVPCVRKEITIRNETGRRYQKNTARFHVSLF